jgi:hypothetical protein
LILTNNSKIVFAKRLITGEIISGKKLEKLKLNQDRNHFFDLPCK